MSDQTEDLLPEELETDEAPPEEIVKHAAAEQCQSISYTYTEPTIYFEYAYETAKLASSKNIKNCRKRLMS